MRHFYKFSLFKTVAITCPEYTLERQNFGNLEVEIETRCSVKDFLGVQKTLVSWSKSVENGNVLAWNVSDCWNSASMATHFGHFLKLGSSIWSRDLGSVCTGTGCQSKSSRNFCNQGRKLILLKKHWIPNLKWNIIFHFNNVSMNGLTNKLDT